MLLTMTIALGAATPMAALTDEYLRELWKASPMTASQAGYHQDGVDGKLDDLSADARKRRAEWLRQFAARLDAVKADGDDAADRALMHDAVALERLELDEAHDFAKRCDAPLDALGGAFFQLATRPYAPEAKRLADVVARLRALPRYLEQARAGLTTSVDAFREAAKDDGDGLIDYLEHDLADVFHHSADLKAPTETAIKAIRDYLSFVDKELPKKPHADFRYGAALYEKRFKPYLQTSRTPAEVLAAAKARVKALHEQMRALAKKIDPKGDIRSALNIIANDHPKPEALFESVRNELDDARRFVQDKKLLTLPSHDNLRVIETPPFLRSQLGVAAFDGAPPLQPELGAFYYVTPFPKDWPAQKIEAKLREYNRYMLMLITIHEAMPGHYVQFESASKLEPINKRVLRWLLGSNAYVEGWAVYAQQMMIDAGFWNHDPKLALSNAKLELRSVTNAILDIELQTGNLTDEDALKLMMDDAFQERPEAELKLRRAKLSVTQLCSYYVGLQSWEEAHHIAMSKPGFSERAFNDYALGKGAITMPTLIEWLKNQSFK